MRLQFPAGMWYKGRGGTGKLMQEIVTKVLEAEKSAEQHIQEARSKSAEIRALADRQVQTKLQEAREQAAKRSQEILEKARSQVRAEHEKALERTRDENREFFQSHEEDIKRAVEAVTGLVTAPQWSR